jgi:hypothetical protein
MANTFQALRGRAIRHHKFRNGASFLSELPDSLSELPNFCCEPGTFEQKAFEQKDAARRSRNHKRRWYRRVGVWAYRRKRRAKASVSREESSRKCAKFNVSRTKVFVRRLSGALWESTVAERDRRTRIGTAGGREWEDFPTNAAQPGSSQASMSRSPA